MAYTDYLNEAIDDLAGSLAAVSGLRVITDPTKIVPNCVFLDAPTFETYAGNGNIVKMTFSVKVIGSGPAGLPVLRSILAIVANVISSNVVVLNGTPTMIAVGGQEFPGYDLTVSLQAQAG